MILFLSAILTIGGAVGLLLTAKGTWHGPALGLAIQPVWAVFNAAVGAWPMQVTVLLYTAVHFINLRRSRTEAVT